MAHRGHFLAERSASPAWSPDGARLAYFINGGGDPLFIADRMGADPREILRDAAGIHNHNPMWSQDGEWIYLLRGAEATDNMDVWRVRPSGRSLEQLTHVRGAVNFLAPLDARTVLYIARAADRSGPWLWSLDTEHKVSRRVVSGLQQYTSVSVSRDGRRAVATVAHPTVGLWRVPLLDRLAEDRDVQTDALPTVRARGPRFGGASLFYLSASGRGDGLWRHQDGRPSEVWKGGDEAVSEPPAVSRDGRRIAIVTRQEGKRRLVIMSGDGTNPRTLAGSIEIQGAAGQASADWSPDGNWIVTGGSDAQGSALFLVPVNGGPPKRLVAGRGLNPAWSPDGEMIVYSNSAGVGGQAELLGVRPDGRRVALPELRVRPGAYRFLRDGTGMVYLPRNQSVDFWLFDLNTGISRPLTRLTDQGKLLTFDISPDGKQIVFDRSRENSDIVLLELPQ